VPRRSSYDPFVVNCGSPDDGVNAVTVLDSRLEWREHNDGQTRCEDGAFGFSHPRVGNVPPKKPSIPARAIAKWCGMRTETPRQGQCRNHR